MMENIENGKLNGEDRRHFVDFPGVVFFDEMADHIGLLPGCEILEFEADGIVDVKIEFTYAGNRFSVDTAFGDFRFFVEDPNCDEDILIEVANHLRRLLEKADESF